MGNVARLFGKKFAPATIPLGDTAYRNLLTDCVRELREQNAQLDARYGICRHDRWDLNQEMAFSSCQARERSSSVRRWPLPAATPRRGNNGSGDGRTERSVRNSHSRHGALGSTERCTSSPN